MQRAMLYLQNSKQKINCMSLGHLSLSIIMPSDLEKILTDVEKKLPARLTSPIYTLLNHILCIIYDLVWLV